MRRSHKRHAASARGRKRHGPGLGERGAGSGAAPDARLLRETLGLGGKHIGSNNWVVNGARTASGKPLLANDPHLGAQIPSIWYLAAIQGDKIHAVGATLPGLPAVVIGHNENIAWGVTNFGPGRAGCVCRADQPGQPEPVRGQRPVGRHADRPGGNQGQGRGGADPLGRAGDPARPAGLRRNRRARPGPGAALACARPGRHDDRWPSSASTMRRTGTTSPRPSDPTSRPCRTSSMRTRRETSAITDRGRSRFGRRATAAIRCPGGRTSSPGRAGFRSSDLPHVYNPAQGYVVNANNNVVPDNYPYFLTHDWAEPYRAERIVELLTAKNGLTPDDLRASRATSSRRRRRSCCRCCCR